MNIVRIGRKRIAVIGLYCRGDHIEINCGVYRRNHKPFGQAEAWTGESLGGDIPEAALLEWGIAQGFLKFDNNGRKFL
ncbi:MAG: hypothetical protein ABSA97_14200 [Verrucomicrobiia bacterium]